ncbi:MAG: zinc/iron-chelating domain-containing protein [Proteobacteria bacterium]|nr:zinc/iron-chelating domain-containing protein [Pseudomonadota bacterium]MBU1595123.1 zinc/iron-chelating domain-containing protein [Pseudomonadota bacterium]
MKPADPVRDADACRRCAETSGTCCSLSPGQEEFCFPLSARERADMESAGAEALMFFAQENTAAFVDNICRLFPGEDARVRALFPAGGGHDRLALSPSGQCLLLGPEGCRLPREARPYYCRLFPFWVRAGRQMYFEFKDCLALRESRGGAGLLKRLGMTETGVFDLYQRLREAWGLTGHR